MSVKKIVTNNIVLLSAEECTQYINAFNVIKQDVINVDDKKYQIAFFNENCGIAICIFPIGVKSYFRFGNWEE